MPSIEVANPPAPDRDALTAEWRVAHRAAVRHLINASWSECGCTAQRLCNDGQVLEDRTEACELALNYPRRSAAFLLADEIAEGMAS